MRVKLKDICTKITDGSHFSPIDTKNGYPMLSIQDMLTNGFDYSKCKHISKSDYDSLVKNGCKPEKSDVLIAKDGSYLKEIFVVTEDKEEVVLSSIAILRPNTQIINPHFLKYYLSTESIKDEVARKYVSGSVLKRIILKNFENIEIDLPDRKIQDKIAEILSGIDEQINRNNEVVKKLQVLGNTIYSKNAKVQTSTFNIENVCKPIWGNCPAGEYILSQYSDNTIPYASGAGDIDNNISVNPKSFTNKQTRIVHKNDICISVAGTVGKIAIATEDICIGRAMLGFSNPKLYGYIYFGLNSYVSALRKKATGAIQKIINSEHLSIVNLPTYTDDVIKNLNLIVDAMLRIEMYTKQLVQLKEKLLPLLINGQLST